jgi:nucleoside 2-deoxyribosyltransferase
LKQLRQEYGQENVFPNDKHLKRSSSRIKAHHKHGSETSETIALRSKLMKMYFGHIDDAEVVVIMNEKRGREYYRIGTTIELGYALARNKRVAFTRHPTNSNILSLMLSNKRNIGLLEQGKTSLPEKRAGKTSSCDESSISRCVRARHHARILPLTAS